MGRSVRQLKEFRECRRAAFKSHCYLYCTPPSFSTLLGTILWAIRMTLRYIQLFLEWFLKWWNRWIQDLEAINSWCLKWHMRLNPKKTESIVINRSRTSAPGYGELTLGGAELEEVKSLRILGVTFDPKLTFEMWCRRQPGILGSCAEQENYLIVHVCSRVISMHMLCPA